MHAQRAATGTIDHKLQRCLSGGVQNPYAFSMAHCKGAQPLYVTSLCALTIAALGQVK